MMNPSSPAIVTHEPLSNCCSARIITDASGPDVCSACKEHCEPTTGEQGGEMERLIEDAERYIRGEELLHHAVPWFTEKMVEGLRSLQARNSELEQGQITLMQEQNETYGRYLEETRKLKEERALAKSVAEQVLSCPMARAHCSDCANAVHALSPSDHE